jgi:hypothetical protein
MVDFRTAAVGEGWPTGGSYVDIPLATSLYTSVPIGFTRTTGGIMSVLILPFIYEGGAPVEFCLSADFAGDAFRLIVTHHAPIKAASTMMTMGVG